MSDGRRSNWPSSQWYSTVTFWPSTEPVSLRPLRKAVTMRAEPSADPPSTNPITGITPCCACAPSGHAAAALPSSDMNSRRFIALAPNPMINRSIAGHGCASQQKWSPLVRFGSFTPFPLSRHVRFAPKSGHLANACVYEYTP